MSRLLFHPGVTFISGLTALASFCTLIAGLTPLAKVPHGDAIVTAAGIIGPIALFFATYGRSPASAVDNSK